MRQRWSLVWTSVKHFNCFLILCYFIIYTVNEVRIPGNWLHKSMSQCKLLIVPEKGCFGQPKYSICQKAFYVVSVSAFIFFEKLDNFCKNINCELLIDSNVYEHQGGARNSKVRRSFTKTIKSIGFYIKVPLPISKVWLADSGQQCQDLI